MKPKLSNGTIYKKTLTFSLRRFAFNFLMIILVAALSTGGFILTDKLFGQGLYGLGAGIIIGIVFVAILAHFFSYIFKAGQIAVMTKAVTEDQMPDDVYGTGKAIVKERFLTVALYYAATSIIKAIFNELGRVITKIGGSVGGNSGNAVGSAIHIAINVVVGFLCDCCLGYVFYRKEKSAFKATCEGAVIFFKHGKTLLKNLGRMFGMGLASLLLIGGAFSGIFYLIALQFQGPIMAISNEIKELGQNATENQKVFEFLSNPTYLSISIAVLLGIILWTIVHSTFVRPFILVGVLRNYMETAVEDIPDESEFSILEKHSRKYKKYKKKHPSEV